PDAVHRDRDHGADDRRGRRCRVLRDRDRRAVRVRRRGALVGHAPRQRGRGLMPRTDATLPGLKRGLGSPALFGIVQGFVAASIYFAVGVVAARALGLTWAVFLARAVLFAVLVPSYVEGASLHQERGGATVIARYAFNELWSFVAGWAI